MPLFGVCLVWDFVVGRVNLDIDLTPVLVDETLGPYKWAASSAPTKVAFSVATCFAAAMRADVCLDGVPVMVKTGRWVGDFSAFQNHFTTNPGRSSAMMRPTTKRSKNGSVGG